MAFKTLWGKQVVHWQFSDLVTEQDIVESNQVVFGDSRFDEMRGQIVDFSAVSDVDIGDPALLTEKIRAVAEMDKAAAKSNPHIKVATVVTHEALAAIAHLYAAELADSPWQSEVFNNLEAAQQWLGLDCKVCA